MDKNKAKKLLDVGELLIVIGSAIYVVNLILVNLMGKNPKWMIPVIGVIYVLGVIPAIIGKLNLRKYEKAEKAEKAA